MGIKATNEANGIKNPANLRKVIKYKFIILKNPPFIEFFVQLWRRICECFRIHKINRTYN